MKRKFEVKLTHFITKDYTSWVLESLTAEVQRNIAAQLQTGRFDLSIQELYI